MMTSDDSSTSNHLSVTSVCDVLQGERTNQWNVKGCFRLDWMAVMEVEVMMSHICHSLSLFPASAQQQHICLTLSVFFFPLKKEKKASYVNYLSILCLFRIM